MNWGGIVGFLFWGFTYALIAVGQIDLLARYSWKETGDPKAFLGNDTLSAIKSLWSRNKAVWSLYYLCLFAAMTLIAVAHLNLLGIPSYVCWLSGVLIVGVTEALVYWGRAFLFRVFPERKNPKYWDDLKLVWMFQLRTWPLLAVPVFVLMVMLLPLLR